MSRRSSVNSPTKSNSSNGNLRYPARTGSGDLSSPRSTLEEEQQQLLGGYMSGGRYCLRGNSGSHSSSFSQHLNPHHALNERDFETVSPRKSKTPSKASSRKDSNSSANSPQFLSTSNVQLPSTSQNSVTLPEKRLFAGLNASQDDSGASVRLIDPVQFIELADDQILDEPEAPKIGLFWRSVEFIFDILVIIFWLLKTILFKLGHFLLSPLGILIVGFGGYFLTNCVVGPLFFPEFYPNPNLLGFRPLRVVYKPKASSEAVYVIDETHTTKSFQEAVDQIITNTETSSYLPPPTQMMDRITTQYQEYPGVDERTQTTSDDVAEGPTSDIEARDPTSTSEEPSSPTFLDQQPIHDSNEPAIKESNAPLTPQPANQSPPEDFASISKNAFIVTEGTHTLYQFSPAPGSLSKLGLGTFERLLSNLGLPYFQKTASFVLSDDHPDNHCFQIEANARITIELGEAVKASQFRLKFTVPSTNQPAQKDSIPVKDIEFYGLNIGRADKRELKTLNPANRPDIFHTFSTTIEWTASSNIVNFSVDQDSEASNKYFKQYLVQVKTDTNLDLCISRVNIFGNGIH